MVKGIWDLEKAREVFQKHCNSRVDFQRNFKGAYLWAQRNGLLEEVYQGFVSTHTPIYTYETAQKAASKHTSRKDFHKLDRGNYEWAVRNGVLADITTHMPSHPQKISDEDIIEAAMEFSCRSDFRQGNNRMYKLAGKRGITDKVCKHMDDGPLSDNNVVYIWGVKEIPCVYKIGVTSERLGLERVDYVAKESGLTVEWVKKVPVDNARIVERALLSYGRPFRFDKAFNGSSEFRNLTEEELAKCLNLLEEEEARCQPN